MYILEGNIGAGKSTLLKLLERSVPDISVGFEPLGDWLKQVQGQSLLKNFYENPRRWGYTMETCALLSRIRAHVQDQHKSKPFHIVERSAYSGHACFAFNSYKNGFLSALEWELYNTWFNMLVSTLCQPPRGLIYLRVSPEVAFERIRKRTRDVEMTISLDYIKQLHGRHDEFLIHKKNSISQVDAVPVLVLHCNDDFEQDKKIFEQLRSRVMDFTHQRSILNRSCEYESTCA